MTSLIRTPRSRTSSSRMSLAAVAVAALLTLSACGGGDGDSASDDASPSASSSESSAPSESADAPAGSQPDLEGIPDVVAEVNGEEVTRDEFVPIYQAQFAQAAAEAQATGQAPDEEALKQQTVDDLVSTELLAQEAESRGIEVSDEDVDVELETVAAQNQLGSADELLAAVEAQGISEDQARSQVEAQLLVEELAADEDGSIEPTEQELRTLYDQVKEQAAQSGGGQQIPPFGQAREQLVEQATAQKVGEVAGALVEVLREDADITINL